MGSTSSKPSSPQVWKGNSTGVSQDLIESLQSNPETDVSRRQALELEIQARVAAELKRLRDQESQALREAQEKISAEGSADNDAKPNQHTVSKEVQALRAKLVERRKIRELPDTLESARSEVVRCLRENDRRPLDCWREVEAFKEEVRKLEKGWVDKVVG